jgi:uncharacterized protein
MLLKKKLTLFILLLCSTSIAFASLDSIPERPHPARWVNNLSTEMPNFLSHEEEATLEKKLANFANQTSNQLVIVIVDDLHGDEPWNYATELGHKWGVGQAKFDNGIIILIQPTGAEGKRKLFIAVGYGLESVIPDLTTKQIREEEMYPYFKKGEYFTALNKATDVLISLAKNEYNSSAYSKKNNASLKMPDIIDVLLKYGIWFIPFIGFLFFIIRGWKNRKTWSNGTYLNSSDSGSSSTFSSDSGSSFSSDSSSSSDFGGGDFGGGGSGGDW